jgi:hypothetical protein
VISYGSKLLVWFSTPSAENPCHAHRRPTRLLITGACAAVVLTTAVIAAPPAADASTTSKSHIEADLIRDITAETNKSQPGQTPDICHGPPTMPALVHGYGMRAALHALSDWVENGRTPDSAPRMSLTVPTPPDNFDQLVVFNRDPATNLTRGGIRLPAVAVPIATLDGNRSDLEDDAQGPGGGCYFSGAYDPWNHDSDSWDGNAGLDPSPDPEPELLTLYPTHDNYVRKIAGASVRSVEAGHLLPEDAAKVVLEAVRTPVP